MHRPDGLGKQTAGAVMNTETKQAQAAPKMRRNMSYFWWSAEAARTRTTTAKPALVAVARVEPTADSVEAALPRIAA
jgi:hypothetical protein